MFPSIYARNQSKCTFDLKGKFATDLEVALARNQVHASQLPTVPSERDYWLKQPPDFSYKLYITPGLFSKPLGKSKELKKKMSPSTLYEELHRIRSRLFAPVVEQKEESKIVTRFPHVDPYEAQLMFVKKGKYKSSKYQDPKPFDYRQYESGIPNFVTSYARDPLNLKFKAQCLSKVHGLHPLTEEKRGPRSKEKFITCKPQELKWDSKLLLPKEPWPAKPVSFTRHKSQQSAHSAFIERVEETLSKLWLKEEIMGGTEGQKVGIEGRSMPRTTMDHVTESSHQEGWKAEICAIFPSFQATKKEAQSRRKAAYRSKQKMQSAAVSIERDFEMEQQASRPQEKSRQKGQLSPSLSIAVQGQGLPVHIKPEPLGFLLPNGIAQSVEELRCK